MKKSAHFTIEQRMTCEAIIRRYEFHPGKDECHRACVEAIGKPVSKKTLDNWCKEMQTAKPRKRVRVIEDNELQSGLQNVLDAANVTTPATPKVDPTGLTRLEYLDALIDHEIAELNHNRGSVRILNDLYDARRREAELRQYVTALVGPLDRLQALLTSCIEQELLEPDTQMSTILDDMINALERAADKPKRTAYTDYQHKSRALWKAAGLDHDKQPEIAGSLVMEYEIPENMTIDDLQALDRQIYEACKAEPPAAPMLVYRSTPDPVVEPEPDAEVDPIVEVRAVPAPPTPEDKEVESVSAQTVEPEDQPDKEAVALAVAALSQQRSVRVAEKISAQQEVRNEIARKQMTGEWDKLRVAEQRALNEQAGYESMKDVRQR